MKVLLQPKLGYLPKVDERLHRLCPERGLQACVDCTSLWCESVQLFAYFGGHNRVVVAKDVTFGKGCNCSCLWTIWVNFTSWHSSPLYLQELFNLRHYLKVKDIWVVASWASAHIFVTFYNLNWFLGFVFEWVLVHIPLSVYVYRLINCLSLCSLSLWHSVSITLATDPVASGPTVG